VKIRFVVFDRSWQLEKSDEFTEEWTHPIPHCGDHIVLPNPNELGIVLKRIFQPDGDLVLHVVREEKETTEEKGS
jgi:hypothetical protein